MKTITNIMYPAFALFAVSCVALAAQAQTCQEGCLAKANTALGLDALGQNGHGAYNTAIGCSALFSNGRGLGNTASGFEALKFNTVGVYNTANGYVALQNNTTGSQNTATGIAALNSNTTGNDNTASGDGALRSNTTGKFNTATGSGALASNSIADYNTATGVNALFSNTTGNNNTANGDAALYSNTTGSFNVALGLRAGFNLTTGDRNIDIGNGGQAGESSTIRIGRVEDQTATFIAGIAGATVPTGVAVIVDGSGHLGTTTSSARYKEAIKPMDRTSEAILALQPVTFRYKKELDPDSIPQFGLVAEDVEKVNPDLVARDDQGKPYSVRYEAVNAMLLNEFLKEYTRVEQLKKDFESKSAEQQKQIEALKAQLKEQAALIQKVSDTGRNQQGCSANRSQQSVRQASRQA